MVKKAVYHVIVFIIGIIMAYPLIWMVMSSFKENSTMSSAAGSLTPESFILSNYPTGWKGFGEISFVTFFQNSVFVPVVAILGTVTSSAPVVYRFARFKFEGCGILLAVMLLSTMFSAQVLTTPQYLWYQKLGRVGSYMPLTVPYFSAIQGSFVYLISNSISDISTKSDEATKIDGCSHARIFIRIVLPPIKSVLVMVCIFSFMWRWDDFPSALLYVSKSSMYLASLAFKLFYDPGSPSDYSAMFVMAALSILPSILMFLFFQKYLAEGISTSGLKG